MTPGDRLGLATRAFVLATILGLALGFRSVPAVQGTLVLMALGVVALAAGRYSVVSQRWTIGVEGVLATLTIAQALPEGAVLLPYLVMPGVLAGMASRRPWAVVLVVAAEVTALVAVLAAGGDPVPLRDSLELAAPWFAVSLGTGLLAWWVTQLRGPAAGPEDSSYQSARRLLSQLRTVARRLSSGLDPVSMADHLLIQLHEAVDDTQSALFARTDGGVLVPLAYRGQFAQQTLIPEDPLVEECWLRAEPVQEHRSHGVVATRHRLALPLRAGPRMIGVVLCEAARALTDAQLRRAVHDLDEQAPRLDTALVFDEVRSIATMEERHRVAREIHDGVAQEIAGLGYAVDELAADADDPAQAERLRALRSEITRVVTELRLSIFDLRSDVAPTSGLGSTLSEYVRTVGARSGLTVHLTLDEGPTRLRTEIETELLRIVQEAVTNARKHAAAANLWVDCRIRPPYAQIVVEDDGEGLGEPRADSYGLKIMRERAGRIGAELEIGRRTGPTDVRGTRVAVTVGGDTSPPSPQSVRIPGGADVAGADALRPVGR